MEHLGMCCALMGITFEYSCHKEENDFYFILEKGNTPLVCADVRTTDIVGLSDAWAQ